MGFLDTVKQVAQDAADKAQSTSRALDESGTLDEYRARAQEAIRKAGEGLDRALSSDAPSDGSRGPTGRAVADGPPPAPDTTATDPPPPPPSPPPSPPSPPPPTGA